MGKKVYGIGDIHGDYQIFQQLLETFDPASHQLVLIGDLLDRGTQSKECLLLGQSLVEKQGAVYLKGNHEELLLNFLKEPEDRYLNYLRNGGGETLNSLIHSGATEEYSPSEMSHLIKTYHQGLICFLTSLPLYYEWGNYIFVHAGIDLDKKDWRQTSQRDFLWIREPFHQKKNNTEKQIVFGHTITPSLHGNPSKTALWQSDGKIGIDGGGIYGGSNHGVIFDEQGISQDIELKNLKGAWEPNF